jgi:hypothetical protein
LRHSEPGARKQEPYETEWETPIGPPLRILALGRLRSQTTVASSIVLAV